MFAHRNNEKENERGALMIEAIALLGLMTMMSPMVVRQTAERTAEMEEVAIAGQMKEIKDALSNWIEANYQEKAKSFSSAGQHNKSFSVTAADLAPYLPATYLNGSSFRGNKLVDDFDIGVRAQCTEARKTSCTPSDTEDCSCGTRTNGMVSGLTSTCKCSRYKMTGVVLSKSDSEISDKRASRIASMIGADGGYMRTQGLVNSLYGEGSAEANKIVGSQGMWEGVLSDYFGHLASPISAGGKIAATTIYSSGFSGDYLYRKKVDGLPGANSMFTDLDMGGATNCQGDGCHKINNAGGLEVVGGKILIRSQNTENNQDVSSGDSYAKIALATDSSHIKVDNTLQLNAGSADSISMGNSAISIRSGSNIINMGGGHINLSSPELIDMASKNITLSANTQTNLKGGSAGIYLKNGHANIDASNILLDSNYGDVTINTSSFLLNSEAANIYASADMIIDTDQTMGISAGASITMNAPDLELRGTNINIGNTDSTRNVRIEANTRFDALTQGSADFSQLSASTGAAFMMTNEGSGSNRLNRISTNASQVNLYSNSIYHSSTFRLQHNEIYGAVMNNGNAPHTSFNLGMYGFNVNIYGTNNNSESSFALRNTGLVVNIGNDTVAHLASTYTNRARLAVNEDTGETTATYSNATNAIVDIDTSAYEGRAPYNTHNGDPEFDHFQIDPAYTSVMNDIKLTSRGGARLSEALPNYILKGIYVLDNTYASGPWPCDTSTCSYSAPYYSFNDLGLSSGGWEFNCSGITVPNVGTYSHPIKIGGGTCSCSSGSCDGTEPSAPGKYVTFNYYSSSYQECPKYTNSDDEEKYLPCWTHPYMGAVPAPGRTVSETGVADSAGLAAYDEGSCPDGYQAVMTITPAAFEFGKVSIVRPDEDDIRYNYGFLDYGDENADVREEAYNATGIIHHATRLHVTQEEILDSDGQIYGWKIAMGLLTPTMNGGYIWTNHLSPGTLTAYVHTYCYFNPDRFTMPNMVIRDHMIHTADNPDADLNL